MEDLILNEKQNFRCFRKQVFSQGWISYLFHFKINRPKGNLHWSFLFFSQNIFFLFFFPQNIFFLSKCYFEDKSSLGNGREKTISVLLLTVHHLLLYQKVSHHLCVTTASFFFLYPHPHGLKIRDLTRGCPACSYSGTVVVCSVQHGSPLLGGCLNSVCLTLPSPDLCQG